MKKIRSTSVSLSLVACLGMLFPITVWGDHPVAQRQRVVDVKLHQGGLLVGQVVNPQGAAQGSVEVAIVSHGRELARAKTDHLGRFAMKGLSSGVYRLATSGATLPVRAWKQEVAPPSSAVGALLVAGTTVRGQQAVYIPNANAGAASFNQMNHEAAAASYGPGATYETVVTPSEPTYVGGAETNSVVVNGESAATQSGAAASESAGYVDGGVYGGGQGGAVGYGGYSGAAGSGGLLSGGISTPLLIGGAVAAAIAIPVAVASDDAS